MEVFNSEPHSEKLWRTEKISITKTHNKELFILCDYRGLNLSEVIKTIITSHFNWSTSSILKLHIKGTT